MKTGSSLFLSAAFLLHFFMLYFFGIAWMGSTFIFYYLIYLFLKRLILLFRNLSFKRVVLRNIQILFVLILITELMFTFVIKNMNNYMENEYGVYFSEYKRKSQIKLLHFIGFKDVQFSWTEGYKPFSKRTHKSYEFRNSYITNKEGFRGKLPNLNKDSNEYRIVVLGDSFIEGFGTNDDSTFCTLLEKQLSEKYLNNKISVINGGICGNNPLYEIVLYQNKLEKYNPDLIIVETNLTDLRDVEFQVKRNKMPIHEYFYAISHIFRGFYFGVFNNKVNNEKSSKKIAEARKQYVDLIIQSLLKFTRTLQKNNQSIAVIYNPMILELYRISADDLPTTMLQQELLKSGIPVIDLKTEYKNDNFTTDSIGKYYWPEDGHHKPDGYRLMSDKVTNFLIQRGYVRTN